MLKLTIFVIILGIGIYYYNSLNQIIPSPIVSTKNGQVQGITSKTRDGKTFYEYFGIPFAKPPLGDLRFEAPEPLRSNWDGVMDASKLKSECLQINLMLLKHVGSEDCLYLNVFTSTPSSSGKLKPVLFWIHGGLFVFGSSNMYRGNYLLDEDVVLVTINYRLAALGFLNTGDGVVRGNMGLKDQNMGLKWVKENIAAFGGDPNNIVLVGESAGGASVHYHLLSKMSKGLFTKAILQSGVAGSSWAIKPNPLQQAKRYAKNVNCPTESTKDMVLCLKNISSDAILDGHKESLPHLKDPETLFAPTVEAINDENAFLTEHPLVSIRKGNSIQVPTIIGYNSHEGLLMSPILVRSEEMLQTFEKDFNNAMGNFIMFPTDDKAAFNSAMSKVRDFYFGVGERIDTFDKFENYTSVITDFMWAANVHETVKHLQVQESSPVYLYYYSYKGTFTIANVLLALKGHFPLAIEFIRYKLERVFREKVLGQEYIHYGSCHADELALLFKLEGLYDVWKDHNDYGFSKEVVKLWVDFAYGIQPLKFKGVDWKPLTEPKKPKYLLIDKKSEIINQPNKERIAFIESISV